MPPKWCTTARTRAKAAEGPRRGTGGGSLHMSDVIRDDATLAALGIPLSDEEDSEEEKDNKKVSVGLRRPPVGQEDDEKDEDYEQESGTEYTYLY